jgi:hypothetical protein
MCMRSLKFSDSWFDVRCVKKSLGKFLGTIKANQGKRNGFTLEVEGEKVHLIMKSNYTK